MPSDELAFLPMTELARLIRRKALSPVEVARAALERIERLDSRLRCFITVTAERALREARAAEARLMRRRPLGLLLGVPVAVKDVFLTEGVPTTAGSKLLAEWIPEYDATVVRRLRAAGAVLLGKLNMHEFAFGPEGTNPHYGTPANPWDASRLPGGSSSGAAVAVATGLAAAAMGSDTGGSIRIPASLCGVVGLKPTFGRVSCHGVFPLASSLDHVGPLTRTVADAALCLRVIAGADPEDPNARRERVPDYPRALNLDLRDLRVGVPRGDFFDQLDAEVATLVEAAIQRLKRLGARLRPIHLPTFGPAWAATVTIISAEAMLGHERLLAERGTEYGADVRERLMAGGRIPATAYLKALQVQKAALDEFGTAFCKVDLMVTPTVPIPAPMLDDESVAFGGTVDSVRNALTRLTRPVNLVGHPALSIPCGFTAAGLPVGLQLVGRPFDEATLLRAGHAYEQATEWHRRRPPIEVRA
jgi:aspartyl-tRNA(Asn)/glutamyl-tRNA(Gln) amidotransferase subunit A